MKKLVAASMFAFLLFPTAAEARTVRRHHVRRHHVRPLFTTNPTGTRCVTPDGYPYVTSYLTCRPR